MLNLRFDLAKQWRDQVYALALTEHWGHILGVKCLTEVNDYRDVKDLTSFQAIGLLQQHPAFLQSYYGKLEEFQALSSHSHADAQIVAAATFLELHVEQLKLDGAITAYNTGIAAYKSGKRNATYLQRFSDSLNRIRGKH